MRVQHNIMAMNAYRNYNTNNNALSKNLEKLSSGYAINRAGDDAAGLAISEKMRAQITGLDTAQNNAQSGINLVQTAEGAMTEVHDMLNRMYELANQSANGTYDEIDREQLNKEVQELMDEIDRIADSTNFNGIDLLDGSLDPNSPIDTSIGVTFSGTSALTEGVTSTAPAFSLDLSGLQFKNTGASSVGSSATKFTVKVTVSDGNGGTASLSFNLTADVAAGSMIKASDLELTADQTITLGGLKYTVAQNATGTSLNFSLKAGEESKLGNATATLNPAFKVTGVTTSGTDAAKATKVSDIYNTGSQNITVGKAEKAEQLAKTEFNLTAEMLKQGSTIKIGNQTFSFDFGVSTTTETVIGVKDLLNSKGEIDTANIAEVASRIEAASKNATDNNDYFTIGHAGGGKLVITSLDSATLATKAEELKTVADVESLISVKGAPKNNSALTLQIGDTNDTFNKLDVSIQDMHAKSLGISTIDISTQDGAQAATNLIKEAINKVSDVRGTLGATQNRLEHTINSLSVSEENIQSAESSIRDTDVAEEMMAYTKNNILIQSAQAMLAQANQVPQGVLQLLQ